MNKKPIYRYSNYFASIFFFGLIEILPFFILMPLFLKIGIMLLLCYFWLAFYFRIVSIYDDYIEFFFPFRLEPLYKRRKTSFSYAEMEKVILFYGTGHGASPELKFVLKQKRYYLWMYKNNSFRIMPDGKYSKIKKLLGFLKEKNVEVILKMDEDSRYLFEPDE